MKLIFMGTPDFAVPSLKAVHAAGHEIACVYTQPPRPGGRRGKQLTNTPVHLAAEELGLEVRHPVSLKDLAAQARFAELEADVALVAAYGLILPQAVLDAPAQGCINVHASILPRWRGAAPIQRAIMAGDSTTGVTLMQMEAGLDTGPMLAKRTVPIGEKTAGELTDELARIGAEMAVEGLADLGALKPERQSDAQATYAPKIDKGETRIDWSVPAEQVERQVRAFSPTPGAWFQLDGERVKLHAARVIGLNGAPGAVLDDQLTIACGNAAIRPLRLQKAGKPAMDTATFLRGNPVPVGTTLR